MWDIFKWFFGIVIVIALAYFIVIGARALLSASSTPSIKNWFANWYKPSAYVPGTVVVGGQIGGNESGSEGQYRNPIADKILNNYKDWNQTSDEPDDFDKRWGGSNQNLGNSKTETQKSNVEDATVNNSKIKANLEVGSTISNNQTVTGYADRNVYTNRYFTIQILDQNKKNIGTVRAYVNGDIQKNGTIPFRGVLSFNTPTTASGYLNFNDSTQVKIYFSGMRTSSVINKLPTMLFASPVGNSGNCVVGGCSMQFCVEQNEVMKVVSSCQYLRAYDCYKRAVCERNSQTGKCGWKMDNSLATCLQTNY